MIKSFYNLLSNKSVVTSIRDVGLRSTDYSFHINQVLLFSSRPLWVCCHTLWLSLPTQCCFPHQSRIEQSSSGFPSAAKTQTTPSFIWGFPCLICLSFRWHRNKGFHLKTNSGEYEWWTGLADLSSGCRVSGHWILTTCFLHLNTEMSIYKLFWSCILYLSLYFLVEQYTHSGLIVNYKTV